MSGIRAFVFASDGCSAKGSKKTFEKTSWSGETLKRVSYGLGDGLEQWSEQLSLGFRLGDWRER